MIPCSATCFLIIVCSHETFYSRINGQCTEKTSSFVLSQQHGYSHCYNCLYLLAASIVDFFFPMRKAKRTAVFHFVFVYLWCTVVIVCHLVQMLSHQHKGQGNVCFWRARGH